MEEQPGVEVASSWLNTVESESESKSAFKDNQTYSQVFLNAFSNQTNNLVPAYANPRNGKK